MGVIHTRDIGGVQGLCILSRIFFYKYSTKQDLNFTLCIHLFNVTTADLIPSLSHSTFSYSLCRLSKARGAANVADNPGRQGQRAQRVSGRWKPTAAEIVSASLCNLVPETYKFDLASIPTTDRLSDFVTGLPMLKMKRHEIDKVSQFHTRTACSGNEGSSIWSALRMGDESYWQQIAIQWQGKAQRQVETQRQTEGQRLRFIGDLKKIKILRLRSRKCGR